MAEALLRTITNYVVASEEDYLKLKELGSLFNSSKNYFYSRFSGVKTMKNLNFIEIKKSIYNGQEDLSFTSKKKNRNKKIQNELSQWDKGYIQNRLEFKAYEHNMNIVEVNASYTSQVCHKCGNFGDRNYSNFKCLNEKCQWQGNADYNAACVIEARRKDNEINLSLTPQQVKSILLKRIKN